MITIENDPEAPQPKHKEKLPAIFKVYHYSGIAHRTCRVCGKMRFVDSKPCHHCGYKDAFCGQGIVNMVGA
jgi:hypothetical protein